MMETETFNTICPYCHKAITVQWRNGLIFDRERYDLIADWLYHRECWDKQVTDMEKL